MRGREREGWEWSIRIEGAREGGESLDEALTKKNLLS